MVDVKYVLDPEVMSQHEVENDEAFHEIGKSQASCS